MSSFDNPGIGAARIPPASPVSPGIPAAGVARGAAPPPTATASPASPPGSTNAAAGVTVEQGVRATAGEAPVDTDRVAEIRTALEQGRYPLNPAQIADAIIAARLMLSVGE